MLRFVASVPLTCWKYICKLNQWSLLSVIYACEFMHMSIYYNAIDFCHSKQTTKYVNGDIHLNGCNKPHTVMANLMAFQLSLFVYVVNECNDL